MFVHLHTHSHYSLLDGLPKIPELVTAAKKMKMPALALTDHGNLYGAIEFYQAAQRHGIKPIIGIEIYVAPRTIAIRDPEEKSFHLTLLAQNREGYDHLIQLTTIAHLEGFYQKPRIDWDLLKKYHKGLIALSGCLSGEIPRALRQQGIEQAETIAKKYLDLFGKDHFYLEVQHRPHTPEQTIVNTGLLKLHEKLGIELVATNDAHYIELEDQEAQDVLLCIQTKKLLSDTDRLSMRNEDYHLASSQEMTQKFGEYPRAIENTLRIADMVDIHLEFGQIQMPAFHLSTGVSPDQRLRQLCEEGAKRRYHEMTPTIQQRLDYELDVITKTGFASYFLIVQDFINWAKGEGIAVGPGRGSAAGSLVSYLTHITDIDPLTYELHFERFLNPERVSQPDIDTDFADTRRDDVLRYVEQKYGKDHVAQIITFGTMAARAVVRDVGRVLGLSYGYCDRLAKMIPFFATLDQAVKQVPELATLIEQDPDAERLMMIAKKLEGVARHTSTHACAVVVTKDVLTRYLPLQYVDQEDRTIITQYAMHPVDSLGLLKIDLLGLKNLTIIEDTLHMVAETTGETIEIEKIPLNDQRTFQLLQAADTVGVFQLESSGMRRYLKELQPTEFEDIIAMVALYRPGPMDFIPDYIDGKHKKRKVSYLDERLRPILEKTYGIAVYQEQVSEIARQLAGWTYGEADILRKAVAKKNRALLNEQEQKLVQSMVNNGISRHVAEQIWEFILPFARYGFNRSHAACYAMIAYRTAYLKAHFPAQFMAALLTSDYGNTDRIAIEINHARQLGIEVLPPDVNESSGSFAVVAESLGETETPRIRFGLKAIKNVGDHIVDVIITERKNNGPYQRLEDLPSRVQDKDLNKKSLESLIKAGALDGLGERSRLLVNLDVLLQFAKRAQEERTSGQRNLFGMLSSHQQPRLTLAEASPAPLPQRLKWEKELLGLYLSGHPLLPYKHLLSRLATPILQLKEIPKGEAITIIGLATAIKRITTKNGDPMLFVTLSDDSAEIEIIVFPTVLKDSFALWQEEALVKVKGRTDTQSGSLKLVVEKAERFQPEVLRLAISVPRQVKKTMFDELKSILAQHPGEYLTVLAIEGKEVDTHSRIDLSAIPAIEQLFGQRSVHVLE